VVGLPLVISRHGLVGAAVLSTAAYGITLGVYLTFLRRLGPMKLRPRADDFTMLRAAARHSVRRVRPRGTTPRSG
jgi:hypothetical protein